MRDWSAKWMQKRDDIVKLRATWEEGKTSGPAVEVDFDAVLDEVRREVKSPAPHAR